MQRIKSMYFSLFLDLFVLIQWNRVSIVKYNYFFSSYALYPFYFFGFISFCDTGIGKYHCKSTSFVFFRFNMYPASHLCDQSFTDCQSQTNTFICLLELDKSCKNIVELIFWNSFTAICNEEMCFVCFCMITESDKSFYCMFDGIV